MGTGQTTVATDMAAGVVGEIYLDGPTRAQPGIIDGDNITNPNRVGRVFTLVAGTDRHAVPGGTGPFFGILANPKVYPNFNGGLTPTLDLPQYSSGEFVYDTTGMFVSLPAAANVGDEALYDTTTGAISTQPTSVAATGAQRIAYASNVATVSLTPAGTPPIGAGTLITTADGQTARVSAVLTGTGGNGTYAVSTVVDHAAQAFSFTNPALPSGKARIPGFSVVRFLLSAAGLGVIGNVN